MQPRRRFIQNVERAPCIPTGQFFRELNTLRFAPGKRDGTLTQANIPQPHIGQSLQFLRNSRPNTEKFQRLIHRHFKNVVNTLAVVLHFERLTVVASPLTGRTRYVHRRQKPHFHLDDAVPFAGFAASARSIEGKPSGVVPPLLRGRRLCKYVSDLRKKSRVGRGVRSRRFPNRTLIDIDHFVDEIKTVNPLVIKRCFLCVLKMPAQRSAQCVVHQGGFSGTGDPGHHRHRPHRKVTGHALEIVSDGIHKRQTRFQRILQELCRHRHNPAPGEICAGERRLRRHDVFGGTFTNHRSTLFPGARPHVDDPIRRVHHVAVVFDGNHGIAGIRQLFHHPDEFFIVALMQTDRRFVEHICHPRQSRTDLPRQTDALHFAPGKRRRLAV